MRKVYILTNFAQYLRSYSPIIVVGEQLKMLTRAGYKPVLICSYGFEPPEDSIFNEVEIKRVEPCHVSNDPQAFSQQDKEEIDVLYEELKEAFEVNSVIITHDLIFLPDYVKHNVAARRLATDRPDLNWIHWVHSATSPGSLIRERSYYGEEYAKILGDKFPNSIIAFPNSYSIPRVALNFGYEEDEVVEVPHSTDPTEGMSVLVKRLYDEKELGDTDIIMVYPLRLDRGKNAEMNVKFMAGCKRQGQSSHLIFCDFQSTGGDKVTYRADLTKLAEDLGVGDRITFLSEFDESASMDIPHETVLELFTLSNVFMMPSKSETYSLVTQEAMMRGNFVIMNHDFAPFRQIFGDRAVYKPFSSNISIQGYDGEINTTYSDEEGFFNDMAIYAKYMLINDKVLNAKTWVRTKRNPDYIFRNHLEPLLYMVAE